MTENLYTYYRSPVGIVKIGGTEQVINHLSFIDNEELMAAAHAGCFTMKLSFVLGAAGFTPDNIETSCNITLDNGVITSSHLTVKASVPNISADQFQQCAEEAKRDCPVSKAYNMDITLEASLA